MKRKRMTEVKVEKTPSPNGKKRKNKFKEDPVDEISKSNRDESCIICGELTVIDNNLHTHKPTKSSNKQEDQHSRKINSKEKDLNDIQDHLRPYFFLKQVILFPQDKIETTLQTIGSPPTWFPLCSSCCTLLDEGITVLREVTKLQKQLEQLVEKIKTQVVSSAVDVIKFENNTAETIISRFLEERSKHLSSNNNQAGIKQEVLSEDKPSFQPIEAKPEDIASDFYDEPCTSSNAEDIKTTHNDFDTEFSLGNCDDDNTPPENQKPVIVEKDVRRSKKKKNQLDDWMTMDQILDSGRYLLDDTINLDYPFPPNLISTAPQKRCSQRGMGVEYGYQDTGEFVCPFTSSSRGQLARHYRKKEYLLSHILKIHYNVTYPWKCDVCHKKIVCATTLRNHLHIHFLEGHQKFPCPHCEVVEVSQHKINYHVVHCHKKLTPKCDLCPKVFSEFKPFLHHLRSAHPEFEYIPKTNFVCDICAKVFKNDKWLRFHQVRHHNARDDADEFSRCDQCPEILINSTGLQYHKKKTHVKEPLCCDRCPQTFSLEIHLKRHMNQHHLGKGSGPCPICGVTVLNVYMHQTTSHPDTMAMTPEEVKDYVDKRHSQKMHKCSKCPESFAFSTLLYHHLKDKHRSSKFKCVECENGYASKMGLKRHYDKIHLNQIFNCEYCHKPMKGKEALYSHKRLSCNVKKEKDMERERNHNV